MAQVECVREWLEDEQLACSCNQKDDSENELTDQQKA